MQSSLERRTTFSATDRLERVKRTLVCMYSVLVHIGMEDTVDTSTETGQVNSSPAMVCCCWAGDGHLRAAPSPRAEGASLTRSSLHLINQASRDEYKLLLAALGVSAIRQRRPRSVLVPAPVEKATTQVASRRAAAQSSLQSAKSQVPCFEPDENSPFWQFGVAPPNL